MGQDIISELVADLEKFFSILASILLYSVTVLGESVHQWSDGIFDVGAAALSSHDSWHVFLLVHAE